MSSNVSKPIRVWHFSSLPADFHYFESLVAHLPQRGIEIAIGSLGTHPRPSWARSDPPTYFEVPGSTGLANPLPALRLARLLSRNRVQVLQTHFFRGAVVGLTAAKLARTPQVIVTRHHSDEMAMIGRLPARTGDRLVTRAADRVMVFSKAVERYLVGVEGLSPDRITQIYLGFDFDHLRAAARAGPNVRAELGLQDRFVVGCVARVFPTKGHEHLIRAVELLRTSIPNISLILVGGGPTEDLESLVREHDLASHVTFLGHRSRGDVPAYLAAMDVMAHPALTEPFGQVVLEALAIGTPTVATNVGGIPEIVTDHKTGLLVAPADPIELAAAIQTYHDDPSLGQSLAAAGQRDVIGRFTVEQMIEGHVQCYREVISSKGLSPSAVR